MSKRPHSNALHRACVAYWKRPHPFIVKREVMYCGICDARIDLGLDVWDGDHEIPHALGGSDDPPNYRPLCLPCHRKKTFTKDIPAIAKMKRVCDRHHGVKRSSTPMPFGKRSKWKKKLSGEVVPRE